MQRKNVALLNYRAEQGGKPKRFFLYGNFTISNANHLKIFSWIG
jgi:hypothetical protein